MSQDNNNNNNKENVTPIVNLVMDVTLPYPVAPRGEWAAKSFGDWENYDWINAYKYYKAVFCIDTCSFFIFKLLQNFDTTKFFGPGGTLLDVNNISGKYLSDMKVHRNGITNYISAIQGDKIAIRLVKYNYYMFIDFVLNCMKFTLVDEEAALQDLEREGCPIVKIYKFKLFFKFRFLK